MKYFLGMLWYCRHAALIRDRRLCDFTYTESRGSNDLLPRLFGKALTLERFRISHLNAKN